MLEGVDRTAPFRVNAGKNVKFVVPQLIRRPERGADFFFRVEHPERAVRARVLAGREEAYSRKAKMVRPPEMVHAPMEAAGERSGTREVVIEVVSEEED